MADINQLAKEFHELEEQLVVCIRCGMCQCVCPVFEQSRKEADVARGKLSLLNALMEKMFDDPIGVSERLNKCLLCGSCAANCPSGVNAVEIFIRARGLLAEYLKLSAPKKLVFRKMLANPKLFNHLVSLAGKLQPLFSQRKSQFQGTSCARFNLPLVGHRHFKPLAKNSFRQETTGHRAPEAPRGSIRVALFTGCLIDKILPNIAHSCVKVFDHLKLDYRIPDHQGCCGIPALASGDRQTFNRLVDYHLTLFDPTDFDYLVTACATCTSTIRKLWPAMSENGHAAALLAGKTMDVNQFLIDVADIDPTAEKDHDSGPVTYHDPCHLKKSLGISEQPRQVITRSAHSIVEMQGPDKCCGMGGSFNLFHYETSSRIGSLKCASIGETGCGTVATGCPACIIQISDMLSQNQSHINVRHPVELYAARL